MLHDQPLHLKRCIHCFNTRLRLRVNQTYQQTCRQAHIQYRQTKQIQTDNANRDINAMQHFLLILVGNSVEQRSLDCSHLQVRMAPLRSLEVSVDVISVFPSNTEMALIYITRVVYRICRVYRRQATTNEVMFTHSVILIIIHSFLENNLVT